MLAEYRSAIESYAAERLDEYTAWIGRTYDKKRARPKEINDPVWGTLELRPLEVLVLDSPLLQRLRRVAQLGVVHWIYPGARHTRLEHSIGALAMMARLLAALDANAEAAIPLEYHEPLRLAALCHDVGHGVMSHVSENALSYCEAIEDLKKEFTSEYFREAQLGEINSFLLVGSPAFRSLLASAAVAARAGAEVDDLPRFMQSCIIGQVVHPEWPVLHQLVSGPFDVDKLDYMTRDAYMSGVPAVTDVNRLVRKVRSVRIPRESAPREIQRLSNAAIGTVVVFGIDRSGNRTVDELTLGRTLLFDKLYRHHKTRACEAMVSAMLVRLAACAVEAGRPEEAALLALRLDDELFLSGAIAAEVRGYSLDAESAAVVEDMRERLRHRVLFVRAVAFSRKMTGDAYDRDGDQATGLTDLLGELEDAQKRRGAAAAIADLTGEMIGPLGLDVVVNGWPGALRDYVWVDGVRSAEGLASSSKAMLISAEGEVIPFETEAPETPQWAAAYQQTRDAAFVFCPPEIAAAVALAAELYLRREYGVRLPSSALTGMRHSPSKGDEERRILERAGIYAGAAPDLLPLPERLRSGDVPTVLADVAARLAGYCQPLVEPDKAGRDVFGPAKVQDFVQQFANDDLIDVALSVFGGLQLIDRRAVVEPLRSLLESQPELRRASLVVFGSPADSSSVATYFALDVAPRYPEIRAVGLGEALGGSEPLIFVDDIIGSGRQGAAIVDAWFGDPRGADELGESRVSLREELREIMRSTRLTFCFAAGLDGGDEALSAALSRNGIEDATIIVGRREATLPTLYSAGDVTEGRRTSFIERCRIIGEQLLSGQTGDKRRERALGYGNKGLLVTFPYNTPSQALTCLWESGTVDGRPWTPLLPRRRKR